MNLTAAILLRNAPVPCRLIAGSEDTEVYRIQWLPSEQEAMSLSPGTLGLLSQELSMASAMNVADRCCAVSVSAAQLLVLFQYFHDILAENYRRSEHINTLSRAALGKAPLPKILSICQEIMGQPITFLSAKGTVIETSLTPKQLSQQNIPALLRMAEQQALPAKLTPEQNSLPCLLTRVMYYESLIGYIVVSYIDHDKSPDLDMESLSQITSMVSSVLWRELFGKQLPKRYSFFMSLLQGDLSDEAIIKQQMEELSLPTYDVYYVLAVDLGNAEPTPQLQQELRAIIGGDIYLCSNYYVAILGRSIDDEVPIDGCPGLTEWLATQDLYAGLSNGFLSLTWIKYAFRQSRIIIPLRKKISMDRVHFSRYEDLLVGHLIHIAHETGVPLLSLVHPKVARIYEYDTEHGTEFLKTLTTYIINFHSLQATANALFLHRNTMYYRLKILRDRFKIDFTDSRFVQKMQVSASVYNYLNKLDTWREWGDQ